jgi:hypothetical protein
MKIDEIVQKIAYAIVMAILDWINKKENTMQNAGKPLPADAIAFRQRLRQFLQNTSGSSEQK